MIVLKFWILQLNKTLAETLLVPALQNIVLNTSFEAIARSVLWPRLFAHDKSHDFYYTCTHRCIPPDQQTRLLAVPQASCQLGPGQLYDNTICCHLITCCASHDLVILWNSQCMHMAWILYTSEKDPLYYCTSIYYMDRDLHTMGVFSLFCKIL